MKEILSPLNIITEMRDEYLASETADFYLNFF